MALRTMLQPAVKLSTSAVSSVAVNSARAYSYKYVNNVTLLGRVGREPQRVGANDAVAFPFFTESTMRFKDGTVKTYPCWHRVLVAKKTLAESVLTSVERGQRCFISGRLAYRAAVEGPDGKMIHSQQAAIVVNDIVFLEKSKKSQAESDSNFSKETVESVN